MARVALATPELPIDDLTYLDLYRLQDLGRTPSGALVETRPLTEAQAQSLLLEAGGQPSPILLDPALRGFWARPTQRVTARLALDTDTARPYSVPARYRNLVGSVDLACEHQEGRPCGDGAHGLLELDSSAGFGPWLSAFSRIQVGANSNDGSASARADRLYANLEWGPAELLVGRNVILIGPGRHTQLLWGDHASPLDQLALKIREFRVPSVPVTIGGAYILGRLAAPQRFNNTLVTLSRAYVNIADRLCLGLSNLLELGGEGAPQLGFWQFAEEHVHRTGPAETEGVSNRRVGVDMTLSLPPLRSTFYSEIVFEDSRRQFGSALAYDTDYLLGWATSALGHKRRYGFTVEFYRTGVRSQEHGLFSAGMTNKGRVVGAPLGPDATSLYVSPRWNLEQLGIALSPWAEVARLGSSTYAFVEHGPVTKLASGTPEVRLRGGAQVIGTLRSGLWLQAGGYLEHVNNEAFEVRSRNNAGLSLALVWQGHSTIK